MANEEIQFSMGMDTGPFAAGIRSAKSLAHEGATKIKESFKEGLKDIFAPLIGAVALGKVFESIKSISEWGKQIKLSAEEAGVSTDFIQGLDAAARKLGISTETAASALSVMSRKIGEARTGSDEAQKAFEKWGISIDGLSSEQVFYKVADAMKAIQDPAQRNAMAFELMGKAAKEMAAALPIGSDAMRQMITDADKLSENQIERLHEIDAKLDEMGRKWKLIWGSIVAANIETPTTALNEDEINQRVEDKLGRKPRGSISHLDQFRDDEAFNAREQVIAEMREEIKAQEAKTELTRGETKLFEQAAAIREKNAMLEKSNASQLNSILEKKAALIEQINRDAANGIKSGADALKLAKLETEEINARKKLVAEADKQDLEAKKNLHDAVMEMRALEHKERMADREAEDIADAKRRLAEEMSGGRLTIAELANSPYRMTGQLGQEQGIARRIQWLDNDRKLAVQKGNYDFADSEATQIKELRDQLNKGNFTEDELNPYARQERQIKVQEDNFNELMELLGGAGVKVIPSNGK